jgi:hypothetical protein
MGADPGYGVPVRIGVYHKCGEQPSCGEVHRIKKTDMVVEDE